MYPGGLGPIHPDLELRIVFVTAEVGLCGSWVAVGVVKRGFGGYWQNQQSDCLAGRSAQGRENDSTLSVI